MINSSVFNTAPVLVSLAAFGTYAFLGHPLTAAVAFPSLALFNLLRFPIVMIPQQIFNLIAARVVSVCCGGGEEGKEGGRTAVCPRGGSIPPLLLWQLPAWLYSTC
jgi:hypothetical protein